MSVFHGLKSAMLPSAVRERNEESEDTSHVGTSVRLIPSTPPLPWKAVALQAAGLWLVTRIAFVIFTYFAVILNGERGTKDLLKVFNAGVLLNAWDKWDVGWYTTIASDGYTKTSTGFFPFFPFMTHLLALVIGMSNVLAASMIVSNVGMLVALIAIGLLAANEFGSNSASWAIKATVAYPMGFFTFAGYSDSWFLAFCTLSLLFARRSMWRWVVLTAFLAGVSRPTGLALIAPLIFEYGRQLYVRGMLSRDRLTVPVIAEGVAVALAVPMGLAVWGAYLWSKFDDPLIWIKAQRSSWDHQALLPWNTIGIAFTTLHTIPAWTFVQARVLMDLGAVLLFIILTIIAARRMPPVFTLYMVMVIGVLITAAVPLDFDPFNGESRYILMSAPIFVMLGRWMSRRPWLDLLVVAGGFLLQGVFTAFWLRGGWIV